MVSKIKRSQVAGMNIHYLNYSLDYFLDAQVKNGFQSIELWCGGPHVWIDHNSYYDAKKIQKKISDRNLQLACVTPENCTYPCQVAAKEPELRERSFMYFSNGIRFTAEAGCSKMEINSGWGNKTESKQEAWKRTVDMLQRLGDVAKEQGVTLVMESLRPEESQIVNSLTDMKNILKELNHSNIKPMVDTCAMCVANETLKDWFEAFGGEIAHMHFIDSNPYGHLIWGDGTQNLGAWIQVLNEYQYEGYLGQEITDGRYYDNPAKEDLRNMKNFERYFEEV